MVILQERLVNLVNQLNMPVIESSLVISRWINQLLTQLKNHTTNIPENLGQPWPLDVKPVESESNFDLDKALSLLPPTHVPGSPAPIPARTFPHFVSILPLSGIKLPPFRGSFNPHLPSPPLYSP